MSGKVSCRYEIHFGIRSKCSNRVDVLTRVKSINITKDFTLANYTHFQFLKEWLIVI